MKNSNICWFGRLGRFPVLPGKILFRLVWSINFFKQLRTRLRQLKTIDPYHLAAMLSLGGIESFVFARQASARREFSSRLAVKKWFLFS